MGKIKVMTKPCRTCGDPMSGAKTYQKIALIRAKKMDRNFVVRTPHGVVKAREGDYLCENMEGTDRWPCKKEIFEDTYQEFPQGDTANEKHGFVTGFKSKAGEYVEVFVNPSRKELHEIKSWKEHGSVRVALTEGGDLYCWDIGTLHPEVQKELGLQEESVPILMGNNYIYVTEHIQYSFLDCTDFKTKLQRSGSVINLHKDSLAWLIGDFEIEHHRFDGVEGVIIRQPFNHVRNPEYHFITLIGQDREKILRTVRDAQETVS